MPSRLRRYDVPGHTHFLTMSCYRRLTFFWHDAMKRVAVEAMRVLQERFKICLVAYVIMPEHLHLLLYPHAKGRDDPTAISELFHAFKKHIGFHGKQCLRTIWSENSNKLWSASLNAWARAEFDKQIIMTTRGYDFNIDRHETLLEKIDYCHKNPVTRGLVERAEDWRWSSFRYYELEDDSLIGMDWDGSWPIV